MATPDRRNIVERPAGSIAGIWYVGIWTLLGLIVGAVIAGFTGSWKALLVTVAVAAVYGCVRAFRMRSYRAEWHQAQADR